MSLKLKLFSPADAYASLKHIGSCECVEDDTYAKLIPLLEGIHVVDQLFHFFDIKIRCRNNCELEGHRVFLEAYVLPQVDPNLEPRKCMRVIDLDLVFDVQQTLECIVEEVEIQDLNPLDDYD